MLTPLDTFEKRIDSYSDKITQILRRNNLDYEDFKNHLLTAVRDSNYLLSADQDSFLGAIFSSASIGLYANPKYNLCYFRVVRNKDGKKLVKLEIGYQGWLEIILRNKDITNVRSEVWREDDEFEYHLGLKPDLIHTPSPNKSAPQGVYAIADFTNDTHKFTVVNKNQIEDIKKIALSRDPYGIWHQEELDPFKWMWRKTAIKQLAKELPKQGGSGAAIELDNLTETGGYVVVDRTGKPIIVDNKGFERKQKQKAKSTHVNELTKTLFS